MVAPAVRASSGNADVRTSTGDVVQASAPAPVTAENFVVPGAMTPDSLLPQRRYSVLAASFPVANLARAESTAAAPFEAVVGQLQKLGYDVRVADVDLGDSGEWRRVLVGEFTTEADARAQMNRVQQTPAFVDAQVIRY